MNEEITKVTNEAECDAALAYIEPFLKKGFDNLPIKEASEIMRVTIMIALYQQETVLATNDHSNRKLFKLFVVEKADDGSELLSPIGTELPFYTINWINEIYRTNLNSTFVGGIFYYIPVVSGITKEKVIRAVPVAITEEVKLQIDALTEKHQMTFSIFDRAALTICHE